MSKLTFFEWDNSLTLRQAIVSQLTTFTIELDDVKTQVKTLHRSYQSVDKKKI